MATEAYKPFLQRFLSITGGPPTLFHADLEPAGDVLKAFNAPVTEFATFYFGSEPPEGYLDGVHKFREAADKQNVDGLHASAVGLTYEEIEREGVKGKGAVLVVGYVELKSSRHRACRVLRNMTNADLYAPCQIRQCGSPHGIPGAGCLQAECFIFACWRTESGGASCAAFEGCSNAVIEMQKGSD